MESARIGSKRHCAIALMLMAVLLFAQWTGLSHRIDHAPLDSISVDASDEHAPSSEHSCASFDAAAVADTIHLPVFIAPLLSGQSVLALWVAFTSWDAPFVLHFSSRAPPLS